MLLVSRALDPNRLGALGVEGILGYGAHNRLTAPLLSRSGGRVLGSVLLCASLPLQFFMRSMRFFRQIRLGTFFV